MTLWLKGENCATVRWFCLKRPRPKPPIGPLRIVGGRPILFQRLKYLYVIRLCRTLQFEFVFCRIQVVIITARYPTLYLRQLTCSGCRPKPSVIVCDRWNCTPHPNYIYYAGLQSATVVNNRT